MTIQDWGTIAAIAFGVIAGGWALFVFFSSRRFPKIIYEIDELSEFDMPSDLIRSIEKSPAKVKISSVGRVCAENVKVRMETNSEIVSLDVRGTVSPARQGRTIATTLDKFNPSESIEMSLLCDGPPLQSVFQEVEITHSQGKGERVDRSQRSPISFSFGPMHFVYDLALGQITSFKFW